ncbi:hypothetical protein J7E87_10910 [Streptomyces sp. ISL-1]|nr:hypothetical protein [Streptomyces sp. ISL-1]MBT2389921.1 hypothetical protein [Streptomyces sp. ISL-1]
MDAEHTSPELELTLALALLPLALLIPAALTVMVMACVRAFRVRSRIPV